MPKKREIDAAKKREEKARQQAETAKKFYQKAEKLADPKLKDVKAAVFETAKLATTAGLTTYTAIAGACKISQSQLYRYVRGEAPVEESKAARIRDYLLRLAANPDNLPAPETVQALSTEPTPANGIEQLAHAVEILAKVTEAAAKSDEEATIEIQKIALVLEDEVDSARTRIDAIEEKLDKSISEFGAVVHEALQEVSSAVATIRETDARWKKTESSMWDEINRLKISEDGIRSWIATEEHKTRWQRVFGK